MPTMTEDLARLAGGIVASRRQRMEMAAERQRETGRRHRAVGDQLREIKTHRETMSREQRKHAAAEQRTRVTEVAALLRQFHRKRQAQHRHQLELAAAERVRAAAFMRDLTGRVAALRETFSASQEAGAKSRRDLAMALHERLAGYRQDRHDAGAAWVGKTARETWHAPVRADRPAEEHRSATVATSHAQPAGVEPSSHAQPAGVEPASHAAAASESATRLGRHRARPGEDTGSP